MSFRNHCHCNKRYLNPRERKKVGKKVSWIIGGGFHWHLPRRTVPWAVSRCLPSFESGSGDPLSNRMAVGLNPDHAPMDFPFRKIDVSNPSISIIVSPRRSIPYPFKMRKMTAACAPPPPTSRAPPPRRPARTRFLSFYCDAPLS